MQVTIKALGKLDTNLQDLMLNYLKRLKILKVSIAENSFKDHQKALTWLFTVPKDIYSIALSEQGVNLTSRQFSELLFSLPHKGYAKAVFIIGGANGITSSYLTKANLVLSFGGLTFPHELFRVLLLEQLYRAETIFLKHPYHK